MNRENLKDKVQELMKSERATKLEAEVVYNRFPNYLRKVFVESAVKESIIAVQTWSTSELYGALPTYIAVGDYKNDEKIEIFLYELPLTTCSLGIHKKGTSKISAINLVGKVRRPRPKLDIGSLFDLKFRRLSNQLYDEVNTQYKTSQVI